MRQFSKLASDVMDQVELSKRIKDILYPVLKDFGYDYLGIKDISTEAIPKSLKGTFRNLSASRTVEVVYIPKGDGLREVLKCYITDLNFKTDDFDYTSLNQMSLTIQKISELNKSLEDKVCFVLTEIAKELKENFIEVLKGEVFEVEYMDWQGLK